MFQKIIHFLKYNNLTTLIVAAALVGSGGAFAASSELRAVADNVLIGRTETVVSIDNAALLNATFDSFDPRLMIVGVSEDADAYHISYTFDTIAVYDGAWRNAKKDGELVVAKKALGDRDLRAYASEQLTQVARAEIAFLKEAQEAEHKKGETRATTLVAYAGLLGLVIDPKVEPLAPVAPTPSEIARRAAVPAESIQGKSLDSESIQGATLDDVATTTVQIPAPDEPIQGLPLDTLDATSTSDMGATATTTEPIPTLAPAATE
ncbi:MAG: hypothetical protein HZA25_01805 [Candidatus Niyogibacteria bacterium]|nr:hypothetical protein [Candidatus Niyogibacteria bacterium]